MYLLYEEVFNGRNDSQKKKAATYEVALAGTAATKEEANKWVNEKPEYRSYTFKGII
jgi:hypothetical protein